MTQGPTPPQNPSWVDLTRTADFELGAATVRPSLCEVTTGDRRVRLQPRIMQVLVALARADGEAVTRDALVESCWGGLSIGEDAINRCIGRLRRLSETDIPGAFSIETLARIGYRLTRAVAQEDDAGDEPAALAAPRRTRAWPFAAAAGLILMAAAAAWLALGRPGPIPQAERIAILPFETSGSDPLPKAFAEELVDGVSNALVKSDLKVMSSDAGARLSGSARGDAAAKLGASYLLDGRVQGDAQALRLNVHLDDLRQRAVLWSATFTRPASQAQAMQEEVAIKIADVLHCALDRSNFPNGQSDNETLGIYLRACDLMHDMDAQDQVRDLLRKVVARQPRFARAWSSLAVASEMAADNLPPDQAAQARRDARAAAKRALELDPKDGYAFMALGDLSPRRAHWAETNAFYLRGLSLEPDNAALNEREAGFLADVGRVDEATTFAQRAYALDPLSPVMANTLANQLSHDGRIEEARATIDRAARLWPDDHDVWSTRMAVEAREGDPDRALALINDSASRPAEWEPDRLAPWRNLALARKSRSSALIDALVRDEFAKLAAGKTNVPRAILMLNNVGRPDQAYAVAAMATDSDPVDPETLFRPFADGMRRDPRFMPLAAKLGLVDYWRRTGKWPDFCAAPDLPYDCKAIAAKLAPKR